MIGPAWSAGCAANQGIGTPDQQTQKTIVPAHIIPACQNAQWPPYQNIIATISMFLGRFQGARLELAAPLSTKALGGGKPVGTNVPAAWGLRALSA